MQRTPQTPSLQSPRLLLAGTAVNIGGMERIVCGLARKFPERGWSVRTVFPAGTDAELLLSWCADQGIQAEASPALREAHLSHTGRDILKLARLVKDSGADIVNIHYGSNFISLKDIVAVRLAGKSRCFVTLHQAVPWEQLDEQKRKMTRMASYLCHTVIAICDATRDVLRDAGVPRRKIVVSRCGIQPPRQTPTQTSARARLGLPPEAFIVSTMANLTRRKGIADLIEAAGRVSDPHRRLRLVIGGEGPERASLERRARTVLGDRAAFIGPVLGDTSDFYAAGDVFALPSYMEGLPLVYLEAAFHGVPCIGTSVGGTTEAVLDGHTGLIVPPAEVGLLAAAIQRMADDAELRGRLGRAALAHVSANFTESVMADRYGDIFDRALLGGGGSVVCSTA